MSKIETQICDRLHILRRYIFSRFYLNDEDSEDIYGDAILKIFQIIRRGKFKEGFSIDAFMRSCAWSVFIDRYRMKTHLKKTHVPEYDYYFKTIEKSPEKQYENFVEIDRFLKKLEYLESIRKKILILLLFQDMNHDEIAESLGVPRSTVSVHILRARKQFGDIHLSKRNERRKNGEI